MVPFPPDRSRYRKHRDDEKSRDEVAAKPVVALAPVQHDFEAGKSNCDQKDSNAVDPKLATAPRLASFLGEFLRVVNQAARQHSRQQPYRNIDEEHPSPGKAVC